MMDGRTEYLTKEKPKLVAALDDLIEKLQSVRKEFKRADVDDTFNVQIGAHNHVIKYLTQTWHG
jgi:hypothetical protein